MYCEPLHCVSCLWLCQVIHRLGVEAPKKSLVENYMIEIARNYKVEYDPDPSMFLEEDAFPSSEATPFMQQDDPGPVPRKLEPEQRYVPFPTGAGASAPPTMQQLPPNPRPGVS